VGSYLGWVWQLCAGLHVTGRRAHPATYPLMSPHSPPAFSHPHPRPHPALPLPLALVLSPQGMIEDLRAAPEGAIVILHACAHNPTGLRGMAAAVATEVATGSRSGGQRTRDAHGALLCAVLGCAVLCCAGRLVVSCCAAVPFSVSAANSC